MHEIRTGTKVVEYQLHETTARSAEVGTHEAMISVDRGQLRVQRANFAKWCEVPSRANESQ